MVTHLTIASADVLVKGIHKYATAMLIVASNILPYGYILLHKDKVRQLSHNLRSCNLNGFYSVYGTQDFFKR